MHVHVYDTQTWKREAVLVGTFPVAFTADGKQLLVQAVKDGTKQSAIIVYDADSFKEKSRILLDPKVNGILGDWALSPDGSTLAMSLRRGESVDVTLWDIASSKPKDVLYTITNSRILTGRSVVKYVFSPDGKRLAAVELLMGIEYVYLRRVIWVWNLTSKNAAIIDDQSQIGQDGIAFSKDGTKLVTTRSAYDATTSKRTISLCIYGEVEEAGTFAYHSRTNGNPFAGQEKWLPESLILLPDGKRVQTTNARIHEKAVALLQPGMTKEEVEDVPGQPDDKKTNDPKIELWAYRKGKTTIIGFASQGKYEGRVSTLNIEDKLMFVGDLDYRSRGGVRP